MQKGVILGCGNRSNARMDIVTLVGKYNLTSDLDIEWNALLSLWRI